MTKIELAWLAGILEGEGSFLMGSPSGPYRIKISLQMTDEDIILRAAKLMGVSSIHHYVRSNKKTHKVYKPIWGITLGGSKAVLLMNKLYPIMGYRRQQQILRTITNWKANPNPRKIINDKLIKEIRAKSIKFKTQQELANYFNLTRETVNKILRKTGRYKSK